VTVVIVEDIGPIRRLTLNRPEKLNALDHHLVEELSNQLAVGANDDSVRVLILAGAGRSFCAGYDLGEEAPLTHDEALAGLRQSLDHLLEIFDHPKPIVAQVHGHCLAGGCDLMMMCDLAVASDDALFGQPEIRFGSTVVAQVMPWLVGARRAKELVMTGRQVSSEEALQIGLVNMVVGRDALEGRALALARELAVVDPEVMRLTKQAINRSWVESGFRTALDAAVEIGAQIEAARAPERDMFERIATEKGLREAIRWRDQRFS
jgi:enoyl-CoA hydratase/carnithine racemase